MTPLIGNEKINNKFDISKFIYSQRFDCFLQSLSSSLIKCLQFMRELDNDCKNQSKRRE